MRRVDLFLGSDLGLWIADHVKPGQVSTVFTLNEEIAAAFQKQDVNVRLGNANAMDFGTAEIGFSIHYPIQLKRELISRYSKIYNLHPGFLPWGRGYYPVFWALWERTPAGSTIHEITEGLDEGPVVAQVQVDYSEEDTGGTLHARVRESEKTLFQQYWERIHRGEALSSLSRGPGGSYHSKKEFFELKQHSQWEAMKTSDLLRLVRALTFQGYSGLEIVVGARKFTLSLQEMTSA